MAQKLTLGDYLLARVQNDIAFSTGGCTKEKRAYRVQQNQANATGASAPSVASILDDWGMEETNEKKAEQCRTPDYVARLQAAKRFLQEKTARENARLAEIRAAKPLFYHDGHKAAGQKVAGWLPARGRLAATERLAVGKCVPNFVDFCLPDGTHISPLLGTTPEKRAFIQFPPQNQAQMPIQSPVQAPTAATGAQPIMQAQAQMQGFMQKKPQMAGQIGLPGTGLDGPIDTRATPMPGTPGHAATNVIDQRGGLDPRGLTVDGNNAAGEAKAGWKMAGAGLLRNNEDVISERFTLGDWLLAACAPDREKKAQVGGVVTEIVPDGSRYWINTNDHGDECAIFVEKNVNSDKIKIGDSVWWQGRDAMWTTKEVREGAKGESDIKIPRIGYSGVSRPGEKIASAGSLGDRLLKAASYLKTVGWTAAADVSKPKRPKRDAAQDDVAMEAISKKRQRAATDLLKSLNRGNRRTRIAR